MNIENSNSQALNALSHEINNLYGYVQIEDETVMTPAINAGPCGAFAHAFLQLWNKKFTEKVHIVFIMVKNSDECWHVLTRLPNGKLYDGGHGIHDESSYEQFIIEDMFEYDEALLNERAYGLNREYPRYCPNFSIHVVRNLIQTYLGRIIL